MTRSSKPGAGRRASRLGVLLLVTTGAVLGMVRLSVWQWHRGRASGSLLNYAYAVEWLTFAAFALVSAGYLLRVRDEPDLAENRPEPAPSGVQIGPPTAGDEPVEDLTYRRILRALRLG